MHGHDVGVWVHAVAGAGVGQRIHGRRRRREAGGVKGRGMMVRQRRRVCEVHHRRAAVRRMRIVGVWLIGRRSGVV